MAAPSGAIISNNPDDFINRLDSSDNFIIFNGGDSDRDFNGNGGNDTFITGEGSQRINTGSGNDAISTDGGDDVIRDNGGVSNRLFAGDGDDQIFASAGGGIINSGLGNDLVEINGPNGTYTVQLELDASTGIDTFDTTRNTNFQTLSEGKVIFDVLGVDSPNVSFETLGNGTRISLNGDALVAIDNIQPQQLESLSARQSLFV